MLVDQGLRTVLICLLLVLVSGCTTSVQSANTTVSTLTECPEKPPGSLDSDQVKSVVLGTQAVTESGMVSPGKYQGYTFSAEAGQKLSYRTSQDICTWIFTPDNEVLNSTNIPVSGKYVMQVSALTNTTFEIEMSLKATEQVAQNFVPQFASTDSATTRKAQRFSTSEFPKTSCGDSLPTDLRDYPVTFYPVFVPYSDINLAKARSYFCLDSLKVRRKDTQEIAVQVSSFTSRRRAIVFADFISSELNNAEIGQPTVVYPRY